MNIISAYTGFGLIIITIVLIVIIGLVYHEKLEIIKRKNISTRKRKHLLIFVKYICIPLIFILIFIINVLQYML